LWLKVLIRWDSCFADAVRAGAVIPLPGGGRVADDDGHGYDQAR
jgi:hypothetical protein